MILLPLLFAVSTAHAASFTFTDPACVAGFTITSAGTVVCLATPGPAPGPTPVPDPTNCSGFSSTLVMHINIPIAGTGAGPRVYNTDSKTLGGAGANFRGTDIIVIKFQAPATSPEHPIFTLGVTHAGGSDGPSSTRTFSISTQACDFDSPDAIKTVESNVWSPRFTTSGAGGSAINLIAGQIYFINVKNFAYGQQRCSATCNVFAAPGFS